MNYDLNFDWQTYLNNYDDLKRADINTKDAALQHWLTYGKNEGRTDIDIIKKTAISLGWNCYPAVYGVEIGLSEKRKMAIGHAYLI